MHSWSGFVHEVDSFYGVDMQCLNDAFHQEQRDYYLSTSAWADVHPSHLQGPPSCFKQYDLLTLTMAELAAPLQVAPPPCAGRSQLRRPHGKVSERPVPACPTPSPH